MKITNVYFTMTDAQLWAFRRVMNAGTIYSYNDPEMDKCYRMLHSTRFKRLGWGEHNHSITYSELELFARLCEAFKRVTPDDEARKSKEVAEILEEYERVKRFVNKYKTEE